MDSLLYMLGFVFTTHLFLNFLVIFLRRLEITPHEAEVTSLNLPWNQNLSKNNSLAILYFYSSFQSVPLRALYSLLMESISFFRTSTLFLGFFFFDKVLGLLFVAYIFYFFAKQEEILIKLNQKHPSNKPHTLREGES